VPSLLNPVIGLLMLRTRAEGDDTLAGTLTGSEARPGEQVGVLVGLGHPTHAPCGATNRAVRRSRCASWTTPARERERRRRSGARWAHTCGRSARHRPPCLFR
jgi:hypothetical protein